MWGNFLPDKEFRYLRHVVTRLAITSINSTNLANRARTFLSGSSCRHEGRTVPSPPSQLQQGDTWHAVSEDPLSGFLLIVRTGRIVTAHVDTL